MQVNLAFWGGAAANPMYVNLNTTFALGLVVWDGNPAKNPANVVSNRVECQPINGVPPYTYTWTAISNPDSINITASANIGTTFWKNMVAGTLVQGTFKCIVEDAVHTVISTETVSVELEHATME